MRHACGLKKITRIERSRRYKLLTGQQSIVNTSITNDLMTKFLGLIHDRMTECLYPKPLTTFETGIKPEPVFLVPLIEEGKEALKKINITIGLGLDDWDIDYYYNLFVNDMRRNPTNVECFDLGQCNSEHSRHWFFKGRLIIDGEEVQHTLIELIKQPLRNTPANSVIAFQDNSSAIRGYKIHTIVPEHPGRPSCFIDSGVHYHMIFTADGNSWNRCILCW